MKKPVPNLLQELKKSRGYPEFQNKSVIEKLLNECICTIKNLNKVGVTEHVFEVPPFIIGYPVYDLECITKGVVSGIKKSGLKTMFVKPNKIFIVW